MQNLAQGEVGSNFHQNLTVIYYARFYLELNGLDLSSH